MFLAQSYISEEFFCDGQVCKRKITEGSGSALAQNTKVTLSESIYSETTSNIISSTAHKVHKIIAYPESSTISIYDFMLLTMNIGEESWFKLPYSLHGVPNATWDTVWFQLTIESVDYVPDLLSLPQYLPFLREHRLGSQKLALKRVLNEGQGQFALINSRILYNYELVLENGCVIENEAGKTYPLGRNPHPLMHPGLHLAFFTMRSNEKAVIKLPPGTHVSQKFLSNSLWAYIFIEHIDFCKDLLYPQHQPFIEETPLKSDNSVIKRIIKPGSGPTIQHAAKVWVSFEGRLEDGYQFQKPKEEVINLMSSKIYSEAIILGICSMRRGEEAWIKGSPDTHLYKEGYEGETLWFHFYVKEYLESIEKIHPRMTIEEKIQEAQVLLNIAKRLFSSGTKKECKTIYNDVITAFVLKKDGFGMLSDEVKPMFIDIKGRAMMNLALMMIKEVEESDKEDFKIKTLQKIIDMANEMLRYDDKYIKAYYRRGTAYYLKRMYEEATQDFTQVLSLDNLNKPATSYLAKIRKETQKSQNKEKKVYQGIFNDPRWLQEAEREEAEIKFRAAQQAKEEQEWQIKYNKRKEEMEQLSEEYAKTLMDLENGVVVDMEDTADPLTDLMLLDS